MANREIKFEREEVIGHFPIQPPELKVALIFATLSRSNNCELGWRTKKKTLK